MPPISFRGLQGEADYQAMFSIREKCLLADEGDALSPEEAFPTLETLALSFPLPTKLGEDQSLILVEHKDVVIGYQFIFYWRHRKGMSYGHRGYLTPTWRGRGIGKAMLGRAERDLGG